MCLSVLSDFLSDLCVSGVFVGLVGQFSRSVCLSTWPLCPYGLPVCLVCLSCQSVSMSGVSVCLVYLSGQSVIISCFFASFRKLC